MVAGAWPSENVVEYLGQALLDEQRAGKEQYSKLEAKFIAMEKTMQQIGKSVREKQPSYKNSFDAADARESEVVADPSMAISVGLPENAIQELERRLQVSISTAFEEANGATRGYVDERCNTLFDRALSTQQAVPTEPTDKLPPVSSAGGISPEQLDEVLSARHKPLERGLAAVEARLKSLEKAPKPDPKALHELQQSLATTCKLQEAFPSQIRSLEEKLSRRMTGLMEGMQDEISKKVSQNEMKESQEGVDRRMTALGARMTHLEQGLGDI